MRKDEERKEDRRQSLLDAAASVFVRKGYHKTLISDIVAESGVGQGTFYRYFQDKREIFEVLLENFFADLLAEFSEMSSRLPADLEEYRTASINALSRVAHTVEQNRKIVLLFLREAPAIDRRFERSLGELYEEFAKLAKFYLDHAVAKGFARRCNTELVAQTLIGIGLRLTDNWLAGRFPEQSISELIEEVVDFAFFGFGKPGESSSPTAGR